MAAKDQYPELNLGSGAKWIKHLTRDRINNFTGGRWGDLNLSHVLYTHRIDNEEHVKLQVYVEFDSGWSVP